MSNFFVSVFVAVFLVASFPIIAPIATQGTMALAGGGGGDQAAPEKKAGSKKKKPKKKLDYVPDTLSLRSAKYKPQQRMRDKLEDYGQADSLAGLATSLDRIKKFRRDLDKLFSNASTQQRKIDANNILTMLQRYKNQKKNKVLRANADRILKALAALRAHARVVVAEKAFYKAKHLTKDIGDDIEARIEYEDAVKDYNSALKKVPAVPRNQFERFPSTLKIN